MKKAFTLIELLVVIAIIAILAAILFPVFAQAKLAAKKTVATSNLKQELTAIAIYEGDSDDVTPMSMGNRPDGTATWGAGTVHPVPYNVVDGVWNTPQRWLMAQCFWSNATYPYSKNFGMLSSPSSPNVNVFADVYVAGITPAQSEITMNGLMHALPSGAILQPANAVLLWQNQSVNLTGRGQASPALNCTTPSPSGKQGDPSPCQFDSAGVTGGTFYVIPGTYSTWMYGQRMVDGYADTHAKVVPVGTVIAPNVAAPSGQISDPWAQVNADGTPVSYYNCGVNGPTDQGSSATYPCYFRPDRTW